MKKILTLASVLCASTTIFGQSTNKSFTLSGEIRPRYEMRDGFSSLPSKNESTAQFISQRTRLNADYKEGALSLGISLQDVSVWGDRPTLDKNANNNFGLHQAWAAYKFTDIFALKVGRQELAYDDHRILGNVGWAQQARSHDAMLLKFDNLGKNFKLDVGATYNQESEKNKNTPYSYTNKAMQYAWLNQANENYYLSLLMLNNGTQLADDSDMNIRYSQTFGFYMRNTKNDNWDFGGALYGQTGKDVNNTKVSAYYVSAYANKKINENFKVGAGLEILSGTDQNETDGKNHSFNPLYGTNHKFNGTMDYFYVGNHINNVGLQDYYLKTVYKKNKFTADLTGHFMLSAADVYKVNDKLDNYLGFEVDLTLGYKVSNNFNIQGGYSHMFAGDTMFDIKNVSTETHKNNGGWAWVMLAFTPKFFSL